MSFVTQQVSIGSRQPVHQHKMCSKCESMRPPEGGINMSPTKWICAVCWTKRATTRNLLQNAATKATTPTKK